MRIAVVKPDFGVVGGFELVVRRLVRRWRDQGHDAGVVTVRHDVDLASSIGTAATRELARRSPRFVGYLARVAAFRRLDLTGFDLVVSTQPPSYAVRHDRHLALFYHHDRAFYDLAEPLVEAGLLSDPEGHEALAEIVQNTDAVCFRGVHTFLVPSRTVAGRLARYHGIDRVMPFHAGPGVPTPRPSEVAPADARSGVLCVSRHEFPKRTELFVRAAHEGRWSGALCVGGGSRLASVKALDAALGPPAVEFVPMATQRELSARYAGARCLVAPALDEDYGLTAVEAMAHGTPLVVCADGGSLAELVAGTGAGLVVAAEPAAVAEAVARLRVDDELSRRCAAAGLDAAARRFSWDVAYRQMDEAVARVMAG